MEDNNKSSEVTITRGDPDHPYAKITMKERRSDLEDRRTLHTYLANDRRSGIADRRRRKIRRETF